MSHLSFLALLLFLLAPQKQNLPDAFHKLPEPIRAKATLIVTGTYGRGRGPCIFMPDGSRRWALESWLRIKKVYRGQLGGKSIHVKTVLSPESESPLAQLKVGVEYLVLLRPNEKSLKAIKAGEYVPAWDALDDDEIVAIVALK